MRQRTPAPPAHPARRLIKKRHQSSDELGQQCIDARLLVGFTAAAEVRDGGVMVGVGA